MKQILNVRVDEEFKNEIELIAKEDGISSSEVARNLLYDSISYDEETKSIIDFDNIEVSETIYLDCSDIKQDLPRVVLWLFINLCTNSYVTEQNLNTAKNFLEKLSKDDRLCGELRFEFLKALNDINRVLAQGIQNTVLYFNQPNNMYTLNFSLVFTEVYNFINRNYRADE